MLVTFIYLTSLLKTIFFVKIPSKTSMMYILEDTSKKKGGLSNTLGSSNLILNTRQYHLGTTMQIENRKGYHLLENDGIKKSNLFLEFIS